MKCFVIGGPTLPFWATAILHDEKICFDGCFVIRMGMVYRSRYPPVHGYCSSGGAKTYQVPAAPQQCNSFVSCMYQGTIFRHGFVAAILENRRESRTAEETRRAGIGSAHS